MNEDRYQIRIPSLMDEPPINFYPALAQALGGANEAIIVQQIYFYMNINQKKRSQRHYHQGKWWVYHSYKGWCDEEFPWLTPRGLQNIILQLEKRGILESQQGVENPHDRRKWYTINLDKLYTIIQNMSFHSAENVSSDDTENVSSMTKKMHDESSESTSEKTTEKTISPVTDLKRVQTAFEGVGMLRIQDLEMLEQSLRENEYSAEILIATAPRGKGKKFPVPYVLAILKSEKAIAAAPVARPVYVVAAPESDTPVVSREEFMSIMKGLS